MQISKSDYMLYLKHPAWFWLKKHDNDKLPPINAEVQAIFDTGFLFETYAEQLFPKAVKIGFDNTNFMTYRVMPRLTKETIESGANTILQGRLESGKITCIFDVLKRADDKTFDLYEIKSSTFAKSDHFYDLAFQVEVIEGNRYQVRNIYVVHVNNKFIRSGEVKAKDICTITEVTEKVRKLKSFTQKNIKKALKVLKQKTCPDISPVHAHPGAFGDWLSIYKTMAEVDKYSIYHLCSPKSHIKKLEALGIKKIQDIPEDFELSDKQRKKADATKHNKVIVNPKEIKNFLSKIKFPLYFLDYETLSSVIPYFDGLGPYKQLPFQYSLHVIEKPNGKLKHFGYLHQDNSNPIKSLSEKLKTHIGKYGTVLVWNAGFEKGCNEPMSMIEPKYEKFYRGLNKRVIDLMKPFSSGHYIHRDFFGSASIKKVMPTLIPELTYKDLDIQEGNAAQRLWMEAILTRKNEKEKDKVLSDLLRYCELDTLAMVKIYEFLTKIR